MARRPLLVYNPQHTITYNDSNNNNNSNSNNNSRSHSYQQQQQEQHYANFYCPLYFYTMSKQNEKLTVISILTFADDDDDKNPYKLGCLFEFEDHNVGKEYAKQLRMINDCMDRVATASFTRSSLTHWLRDFFSGFFVLEKFQLLHPSPTDLEIFSVAFLS